MEKFMMAGRARSHGFLKPIELLIQRLDVVR